VSDHDCDDPLPRIVEQRTLYEGRILRLDVDRIVEPSGIEVSREVVRHAGSVVLLPVTRDKTLLLVRQYRYAVNAHVLEVPAGTIDDGEVPEEAARRELAEETGYVPGRLEKLAEYYPSPGFLDELMHVFLVTDIEPGVKLTERPDHDEHLELVELSVEDAFARADGGEFKDGKTLVGLSLIRNHPLVAPISSRGA
jgi:ADP-ribose pyrophosphatase